LDKLFVFSASLLMIWTSLVFAALDSEEEFVSLVDRIAELRDDIGNLKGSVNNLDSVHNKLSKQLFDYETEFKSRFEKVLVPLLSWPSVALTTRAISWTELQRTKMILKTLQTRLIYEPLSLIADREIRLEEVDKLKAQLNQSLSKLQSKESLLDLQVEELRQLQGVGREKIRHATGKTKRKPVKG